jgi:hypothetical protein
LNYWSNAFNVARELQLLTDNPLLGIKSFNASKVSKKVIFTQGIALPVKRDRVMAKKILPWIKSVRSSKLLAIRSRLRRCSASP